MAVCVKQTRLKGPNTAPATHHDTGLDPRKVPKVVDQNDRDQVTGREDERVGVTAWAFLNHLVARARKLGQHRPLLWIRCNEAEWHVALLPKVERRELRDVLAVLDIESRRVLFLGRPKALDQILTDPRALQVTGHTVPPVLPVPRLVVTVVAMDVNKNKTFVYFFYNLFRKALQVVELQDQLGDPREIGGSQDLPLCALDIHLEHVVACRPDEALDMGREVEQRCSLLTTRDALRHISDARTGRRYIRDGVVKDPPGDAVLGRQVVLERDILIDTVT